MKFTISHDRNYLLLSEYSNIEYEQLMSSLTKKVEGYHFKKKGLAKKGFEFKGDVYFMDRLGRIPYGMYVEVHDIAKRYRFNMEIEGGMSNFTDQTFDESDFLSWAGDYFEKSEKKPRQYQLDGAIAALKYMRCVEEISTSGGKTLIAFMIFMYLLDRKRINKMVYVVPSVDLASQSCDKFYEYALGANRPINFKTAKQFSGEATPPEDVNIVFGTYQTLSKKDVTFMRQFDAVLEDETHHAKNESSRKIVTTCYNAKYRIGLTGTLPAPNTCAWFTIQSYFGPCVYVLKSEDLIESKFATPINVACIQMKYLDEPTLKNLYDLRMVNSEDKEGSKLLALEKQVMRNDRKRLVYVCNTIAKATKNSLVLFADIKY